MISLQEFLFDSSLSRKDFLNYRPKCERKYKIEVYRNHSFELVEHTIRPYLDFSGFQAEFKYSDYDDSLSFLHVEDNNDLFLLWLDVSRYHIEGLKAFLQERISWLRNKISCPILVVLLSEINIAVDGVEQYSLEPLQRNLREDFFDTRMEPFSGTRLSAKACGEISKELGLRYFPALLLPTLKAIAVDLDNTLYQGVLGEDGPDNLILTEGHKRLQEKLKELVQQGFFLGIVSKNEKEDVEDLFTQREDFPLRREDFTEIYALWEEKAQSLERFAKFLNIHIDSILFVDDNLGELIAVQRQLPQIHLLHAYEDGGKTADVLSYYPGLLRLHEKREDTLRKSDVKANSIRQSLKDDMTEEEYLKNLKVTLSFHLNWMSEAQRISELANKTNQFIFNYRRYSQQQVQTMMKISNWGVLSVSLADRLSDSGIIASFFGRKEGNIVFLEEGFVSCRALGRGLENYIVKGSLQFLLESLHASQILIRFQKGERNIPAENYLCTELPHYEVSPKEFSFQLPQNLITINFEKETLS